MLGSSIPVLIAFVCIALTDSLDGNSSAGYFCVYICFCLFLSIFGGLGVGPLLLAENCAIL